MNSQNVHNVEIHVKNTTLDICRHVNFETIWRCNIYEKFKIIWYKWNETLRFKYINISTLNKYIVNGES